MSLFRREKCYGTYSNRNTNTYTHITLIQVPSDEFNLYSNSKIERKVAFDQNIMFMFSNDLYSNSRAIKISKKYKSHHSKIKDRNKKRTQRRIEYFDMETAN